jgi:hypothetical protein
VVVTGERLGPKLARRTIASLLLTSVRGMLWNSLNIRHALEKLPSAFEITNFFN